MCTYINNSSRRAEKILSRPVPEELTEEPVFERTGLDIEALIREITNAILSEIYDKDNVEKIHLNLSFH